MKKKLLSYTALMVLLITNLVSIFRVINVNADVNDQYIGRIDPYQYSDYGFSIYVSPENQPNISEIAYCFNMDLWEPDGIGHEDAYNNLRFTKEDATRNNISKIVRKPRNSISLGTWTWANFSKRILDIIYNGFPYNASGLQDNLTNGQFRLVTQKAIWYYTDSIEEDNNKVRQMTEEEKVVFRKLIRPTLSAPSDFKLNLFISNDSRFQSLLGVNRNFIPNNTNVSISKTAINSSRELKGATLQIRTGTINTLNGRVVDEWITDGITPHTINLNEGVYSLWEKKAPEGYQIVLGKTFRVNSDGSVDEFKIQTIPPYNQSWDQVNNKQIKLEDGLKPNYSQVFINKINEDNIPLEGANLQIINKENGNIVDEWTSEIENHLITIPTGEYILREVKAPEGYELASDINFTLVNSGKIIINNKVQISNEISMIDYKKKEVKISKVDLNGTELPGATIQIRNEQGKEVEKWISTDQVKTVQLVPGNYTFHEETAPEGYLAVTDITFTVTKDGKITNMKASNGDQARIIDNQLIVTDKKKISLPHTGSIGAMIFILLGLLLSGMALIYRNFTGK